MAIETKSKRIGYLNRQLVLYSYVEVIDLLLNNGYTEL